MNRPPDVCADQQSAGSRALRQQQQHSAERHTHLLQFSGFLPGVNPTEKDRDLVGVRLMPPLPLLPPAPSSSETQQLSPNRLAMPSADKRVLTPLTRGEDMVVAPVAAAASTAAAAAAAAASASTFGARRLFAPLRTGLRAKWFPAKKKEATAIFDIFPVIHVLKWGGGNSARTLSASAGTSFVPMLYRRATLLAAAVLPSYSSAFSSPGLRVNGEAHERTRCWHD